MRRALLLTVLAVLAGAVPASGATTFTIRGAGFGHGIGMSQYGAYGYAKRGVDYRRILRHYYTGTRLGQAPANAVVRVLMQSPSVATFTGATQAGTRRLNADKTYHAARSGAHVVLQSSTGRRLATFASPLRVTSANPITLGGVAGNGRSNGRYRGWFEFRAGSYSGVLAVNAIGLEQYVAGVVSAESPASWPDDALKAQAVAARTYAITTSRNGAGGYDQFPDTRSQVYQGVAAELPSSNRAVNGTRGEVVTYAGRPAITYFFSTSGGRTENVEDSFVGSAPQPWLKSVDDPYDSESPHHRWGPLRYTLASAGAKLGGLVKGRFKGIKVLRRGGSPRIVRAEIIGSRGRTAVNGATLRSRFGLMDSWMTFNAVSAEVEGYGTGDRPAPADDDGDPSGGAGDSAPSVGTDPNGGARPPRGLRARAARVSPGPRVTGSATAARTGTRVLLQRRVDGRWRRAGATRIGTTHRFKVALSRRGVYRVIVGRAVGPVLRAGAEARATPRTPATAPRRRRPASRRPRLRRSASS